MSNKISPSHILKKTKTGKYRLVKVKTIIPSDNIREILVNSSVNSHLVNDHVSNESLDIRKNSDDNTALIQKQLDAFRNYVEKSFILNFVVLSLVTLILLLS